MAVPTAAFQTSPLHTFFIVCVNPVAYRMDDSRFDEAYQRALQRKALFKDYLSRHQVTRIGSPYMMKALLSILHEKVMERLNVALEALYECPELPDDPGLFIAAQLTAQEGSIGEKGTKWIQQINRPTSATFKK